MKTILFLNFMIFFSVTFGQVDLTDGLVLYYPFNGNCNDASGNGNDGTVFGATLVADKFGNPNSAYEFDGIDDYIEPVYPTLNSQSFTFCAWFKNYGFNSNQLSQSLFGGRTGTTTTIIHNMVQWQNQDSIYVQIKGNHGDDNRPTIDTSLNVLDNQWHFWTVTSDSTNFNFYLDGVFVKSVDQTTSGDLTLNALIGAYYHYSTTYIAFFNGIIDEVRLYDRTLNSEEIETLYDLEMAIAELSNVEIIIYPNPAEDKITVEMNSASNVFCYIVIYDIAGRMIIKQLLENSRTTINISGLKEGAYIVRITSREGKILDSEKLIRN